MQQTRKQLPTHLETFDFPQMNPNCLERRDSTVAPQALHLMNNGMVEQLAEHFADARAAARRATTRRRRSSAVYLIALSRPPDRRGEASRRRTRWPSSTERVGDTGRSGKPDRDAAELKALTTLLSRDHELGGVPVRGLRRDGDDRDHADAAPAAASSSACPAASTGRRSPPCSAGTLLGRASADAATPTSSRGRRTFPPKAKAVIHLFMNGGPSQMDLFDPKPVLDQHHGKPYFDKIAGEVEFIKDAGALMRSPFKFAQHGQCGAWVSEAMPHLAGVVDDIAFIRSMYTTNLTHEPAIYLIQSGKMGPGRPTLGVVGGLRPGQREPEPARLRRARRPARPAGQRRRELAGRASCRRCSRARASARPARRC